MKFKMLHAPASIFIIVVSLSLSFSHSAAAGDKVRFSGREKQKDVRASNLIAAKAVADCIRTSLGPKGMDKMITSANGEVNRKLQSLWIPAVGKSTLLIAFFLFLCVLSGYYH
jgi:hypothetical protein